ncbi:MAG: ClbS/DfsB family four-helix bundle protein [bacterium]
MSEPPRTKPELLALIDERWEVLQHLLGKLSDADFERPLGDGWSGKVHVGHLAAWERSLIALLRKEDRHAAMGVSTELWESREANDTESLNRVLAERTSGQSLAEVRALSKATHDELMTLLDSMTQEDLEKPYSEYQPNDPPYNANPVGAWVHGNTWEHYDEHIGWLEAGLQG